MKWRRKLVWALAALAAFTLVVIGAGCVAKIEPQTVFGVAVFRWNYSAAWKKGPMLSQYSETLLKYNGGYVPERVDSFLIRRIAETDSQEELEAIADFYAAKGGQRTPGDVVKMPAASKVRLIPIVLSRIDGYAPFHAIHAVMFLDELRIGEPHFKTFLNVRSQTSDQVYDPVKRMGHEAWLETIALPEAKECFRAWWNEEEPWATKALRDPLAGSNLEISGP